MYILIYSQSHNLFASYLLCIF